MLLKSMLKNLKGMGGVDSRYYESVNSGRIKTPSGGASSAA